MIPAISKTISKNYLPVQYLIQASIIIYLTGFPLQANYNPIEKGVLIGFHFLKYLSYLFEVSAVEIYKSWVMRVVFCFNIPTLFRMSGRLLNVNKRFVLIVWETGLVTFVYIFLMKSFANFSDF